jgi:general secretion pathway protein D
MRKTLLAMLVTSLLLAPLALRADILVADATQNFGTARADASTPAASFIPTPAPALAIAPITAPVIQSANPEVTQTEKEEVLRRQVAQIEARILIDVGCRLENEGKHEDAITKLTEGLKVLPRAKATEADYNRAVRALGAARIQLADMALKAGDKNKAIEQAKKAIECDPTNRQAEGIIVKAKQITAVVQEKPLEQRLDKTPEFLAAREQIKKLFREGKILLNSGQFDEAERRFQQILMLDPYNADAQEMLVMVQAARQPSNQAGAEAARRKMLWQADSAWLLPTGGEIKRPEPEITSTRLENTGLNKAILQKMSEIKFPEINFREASLVDVVTYLSEQSRKLDPKGDGVNIVLGPGVSGGAEATPAPAAGADAPSVGGTGGRSITLQLRNIPMIDALKLIVPLAGLKYRVDSYAVVLLPTDAPDEEMTTETYGVSPDAFTKYAVTAEAGGGGGAEKMGGGASVTQVAIDLKALFKDAGVDFPPGASITFNQKTSKIIIRNTPKNIEAFLKVLPSFDAVPTQVEIEARFIEISQSDLDELGFTWSFSGGSIVGQHTHANLNYNGPNPSGLPDGSMPADTSGAMRDSSKLGGNAIASALSGASSASGGNRVFSLGGVFNGATFNMIIKALSQKQSTDVLNAPKVTTLSTLEATIKVVQSFIYPSEYSEPQAGTGTAITPSIPSGFKTKDVGVILRVTPTVSADKNTIDLMLTPEVTEFLGFIDYSPGPVTFVTTNGTLTVPFKIQQPLFSERSVSTRVVVWDGQTVVLGGLIKENVQKIDDKVPFLGDLPGIGRLFRSKVTNRSKQNLLIFVSARLIGPDGSPIHKEVTRGGLR